MKFIYPAVFHRAEDGSYTGYFPDLEDCYARGETLEDAVEDANEAANNWITAELAEELIDLPPVSEISDIPLNEGDVVRNIAVTIRFYEGWDE
ncbi:MAG: type II toxin-antitoxin system HicB family antitoxin [Blautia sp.]|nr:type II toxin-antitoxin system HicB family antitoxin [Blautia sp.]